MGIIDTENDRLILIRGGGELASGAGWILTKAGFRVLMTEVPHPLMVRWPVCFGTAVSTGRWQVEGIWAELVTRTNEGSAAERQALETDKAVLERIKTSFERGEIPILIDPQLQYLEMLKPKVVVDAIIAKRNTGTKKTMASLTIGLGPGFRAGTDVHAVVETNRGHNLGRLIYEGSAEPNTGIPGVIGGISAERVVYSPISGVFRPQREIGQRVKAGDVLGILENQGSKAEAKARIDGVLRGLLRAGTFVEENVKVGDVDPRGQERYCWTISEKARAVGSAVLLCVMENFRL